MHATRVKSDIDKLRSLQLSIATTGNICALFKKKFSPIKTLVLLSFQFPNYNYACKTCA